MARIRSVKPEFWDDRKLARSTSRDARMLYIGLWNQADEHGRCNGDEQWLKGRVFAFEDDIDVSDVKALLDELVAAGRVRRYEVDGDPYLFLPKLAKHQRLEPNKVESKHPEPPAEDVSASRAVSDAHQSAPRADESAPNEGSSMLLYGAGSMGHGPGSVVRATRTDAETSTRDIIARWMEYVPERPPKDVIGQVSKSVKAMLDEGISPANVARGLRSWADKGLHPRTLTSEVNQVMNARPPSGRGRDQQQTDDLFDRAAARMGVTQ